MSQFALDSVEADVTNYNATTEKHGKNHVKVGDLKFHMMAPNVLLDAFNPKYRPFLFRKAETGEQPGLLENGLTALEHPHLEPLHLDEKFPGYTLQIGSGAGIRKPMQFEEVTLSAFVFKALEGGTVDVTFNARVKVSPEESGKLHFQVKETVEISLIPPKASAQTDLLDEQEAADRARTDADDDEEQDDGAAAESARLIEAGQAA